MDACDLKTSLSMKDPAGLITAHWSILNLRWSRCSSRGDDTKFPPLWFSNSATAGQVITPPWHFSFALCHTTERLSVARVVVQRGPAGYPPPHTPPPLPVVVGYPQGLSNWLWPWSPRPRCRTLPCRTTTCFSICPRGPARSVLTLPGLLGFLKIM